MIHSSFSHIYVEHKALHYPLTGRLLERFPHAGKIHINHYKDVFCRPGQDFQLQKASPKLILAVKNDNFIYKGADVCQSFGNPDFYYTSSILNCIYDCHYCYLQGMYASANIVVFVNIEDFFGAVAGELEKHPVYLTISYDTDLLAFENLVPFTSMWIDFARRHPGLKLEVRTKSVNYSPISHHQPIPGVIMAWTLSPDSVIKDYEKNTPSLASRISAVNEAISDGWNVRLCFDPIIKTTGWQEIYSHFIDYVFTMIPADSICDIEIGAFRMPGDYLKRIRKARLDSKLLHYPFEYRSGVARYSEATEKELLEFVLDCTTKYISREKVFI